MTRCSPPFVMPERRCWVSMGPPPVMPECRCRASMGPPPVVPEYRYRASMARRTLCVHYPWTLGLFKEEPYDTMSMGSRKGLAGDIGQRIS